MTCVYTVHMLDNVDDCEYCDGMSHAHADSETLEKPPVLLTHAHMLIWAMAGAGCEAAPAGHWPWQPIRNECSSSSKIMGAAIAPMVQVVNFLGWVQPRRLTGASCRLCLPAY